MSSTIIALGDKKHGNKTCNRKALERELKQKLPSLKSLLCLLIMKHLKVTISWSMCFYMKISIQKSGQGIKSM